ncbi:MAG: DUF4192 domain-containing protein [Actinomycetota bacterium]|nr:DUF4192 domain-containing protein [Actinomycetota bacterium]
MSTLPVTSGPSSTETLTLSSPDAFLASVPHMLGFACDDSVVLVGLGPDGTGRASQVLLTQRINTPPAWFKAADVRNLARGAAEPMARTGATEVIIAVFGPHAPTPAGELPSARLVDDLVTALDDAGMGVKDALYTDGISRWSFGCDNPTCCPPEGRVIPAEVRTHVAAEFAVAGSAMLPNRDALVGEVATADRGIRDRVDAGIEAARAQVPSSSPPRALEAWRDTAIADVTHAITSQAPVAPEEAAKALVGLGDIRVRDTVLWDLSQSPGAPRAATRGLSQLVRSAPEGHVAPAATVLAVAHWLGGDGARANVSLDRAMADDPDYSLGLMVAAALRSGLPPQSWLEAMSGLSRDTCRHGSNRPDPAPTPATPALTPTASGLSL